MSGPKAPCLNCANRQYQCHAVCPVYQAYLKRRQEYRDILSKARYHEWDHKEHVFETKTKMAKLRNPQRKCNI